MATLQEQGLAYRAKAKLQLEVILAWHALMPRLQGIHRRLQAVTPACTELERGGAPLKTGPLQTGNERARAHLVLIASVQAKHRADSGRDKDCQRSEGCQRGHCSDRLAQEPADRPHCRVRRAQEHTEEIAPVAAHVAPKVLLRARANGQPQAF